MTARELNLAYMDVDAEQAIHHYSQAYQKLYKRTPKDMEALDSEWVVINGARMRVMELQYLTNQLEQEYHQGIEQRRNLIHRIVRWLKQ